LLAEGEIFDTLLGVLAQDIEHGHA
jgi:hypothetical protein